MSDKCRVIAEARLCLQVAWQDLLAVTSEGSVLDDTGEGKASIVGAVLTSHRLLQVSATLQVLAALSLDPCKSAVTSLLWMGPALLFSTSNNQVPLLRKPTRRACQCCL